MSDSISRRGAMHAMCDACDTVTAACPHYPCKRFLAIESLPSTQTERLTDDDFETIRIHLSAFKEDLCDQRRWKEAEDYERLISRFTSFASAQTELITKMQNGIKATDADDVYSCGIRNGMRWCISLLNEKEPTYENCPSEQPEIIRCRDCKYWHREIYNGIEYFNFSSCDLNHHGDGNNFYCADAEGKEE